MKTLKISIAFFLVTLILGCSNDDDNVPFFFDAVAIQGVTIPDQLIRGETVEITVSYLRPTSCHSFSGFDFGGFGNERTVAVINVVIDGDRLSCEESLDEALREESFDFFVGSEASYIFKFWQGRDDEGNNRFLTKEVLVEEQI